MFSQDSTKCISSFDTIQQREIYSQVDSMPQFPGGNDSLKNFILRNLKIENGGCYEDHVYVSFIVEPDGQLSSIKIIKIHFESLRNQTLSLISSMPDWTPGNCKGVLVPVKVVIPVNFKIER